MSKYYKEVKAKADFVELEKEVLKFWEENKTFEKSVTQRSGAEEFVFYDGPPFANGTPHYGHIMVSYVKDVVARFQTMLGKKVERRLGWDCHGLPAEMSAEKQLGVSGRKQIEEYGVEKFAVDRAIRSIKDCNVALLVIDAKEGISDQDKKIASIILEAGKGIIIAVNKWDLIEDKKANTMNQFDKKLSAEIPFLEFAPKIYISALTRQRLPQIFEMAQEVYSQCTKRVSTGLLNKVMKELYALNPPATVKGKRLKILYTTQSGVCPPTFVIFANNADLLKDHYKRYIENKLREAFGFFGTPIRLAIRERSEK